MFTNRQRHDPYKNFRFRALPAAALAGLALFGVVRKFVSKRRGRRPPPIEEASSGSRPIEAVGTSTAGFVGTAPKSARPARPAASRGRRGPRKTKT